jgi:hypothetical protein
MASCLLHSCWCINFGSLEFELGFEFQLFVIFSKNLLPFPSPHFLTSGPASCAAQLGKVLCRPFFFRSGCARRFSPSLVSPAVAQRRSTSRASLPQSPTGGGHLSSPTSGRTEPDSSSGRAAPCPRAVSWFAHRSDRFPAYKASHRLCLLLLFTKT